MQNEIDVAIIGAGAAGLGAMQALKDSHLSAIILEARDRIGGRAHTVNLQGGIVFDEGCGWLHAADKNSFAPLAENLSFELCKERPPWEQHNNNASLPLTNREGFNAAIDSFYERLHRGSMEGPDRPASFWLEPGNRWNAAIDAASTYINGCELDQVSTRDIDAYVATGKNWRVTRGYGALVAAYGAFCNISFNTRVTLIDHANEFIRVETTRGVLQAKAVIVTVPTNLITNEALKFFPALPEKQEAAAGLPLGLANKVMLSIAGAEDLPADGYLNIALIGLRKVAIT